MSEPKLWRSEPRTERAYGSNPANLVDVLERVLDKGIVIAGDIQIDLLEIELLRIRLRLLVASVDKAKELGIDWWECDPGLSSSAAENSLEEENRRLRERVTELEEGTEGDAGAASGRRAESGEPAAASDAGENREGRR